MSKFTSAQRLLIKNIVAELSIKKISDNEIIQEIEKHTGKTISRVSIGNVRRAIKKESFCWYQELRKGRFEYIHAFKERIREIEDLMKRHYKIIEDNPNSPSIQQTSLAEIHRLNVTLSNYFDVAPTIVPNTGANITIGNSISISQQDKEDIIL